MAELFQMWALVEVLGFVCLPLTVTVFHNVPDRGWAFSKTIGVAVLAFFVWLLLMCFHALLFSQYLVAGVFLLLLAINIVGFLHARHTIVKVVRVNFTYIIISEAVFAGMIFLLGWIRSYVPDIRSFEMFMDEGFIAAIMRSPHFPPHDMWLSGYPINYYYYAHFTVGVLAKLLGQSPSIAFNTGISTFYGLTAVNLFGVTCNIVSWAQHQRKTARLSGGEGNEGSAEGQRPDTSFPSLTRAVPYGFLTMLMGLVLGNLAATQQWWEQHGDWTQFNWFDPSRVVDRTINEFPAFSFLLSCFHAHVLALAFTILAIALAFNLFLEHQGKGLLVFGHGLRLPITMGTTALILGGLFTMNGWDFPTYVGLTVVCIVLQQWLVFLSLLLTRVFKHPFFVRSTNSDAEISSFPATARATWLNGGIVSVLLVLVAAVITFFLLHNSTTFVLTASIAALGAIALLYSLRDRSLAFILLLGSLAFTLVAACEVIFLKDVFAGGDFLRMNTVFKFYFQAWARLSVTSGAGLYFILESFRPKATLASDQFWLQRSVRWLWLGGLLLLLLASSVYPLVGTYARANHYMQRTNSLDGINYLQNCKVPDCDYDTSGDYAAIRWLNSNVSGDPVIVEAVGNDYSSYARISAFTGLPTPMGWVGHEYQWRVNWLNNGLNAVDFDSRKSDVDTIYTDPHPAVVMSLVARYHVQYLYVGLLEQMKYPTANLHRFGAFLPVVYSAHGVTIYQVKYNQ